MTLLELCKMFYVDIISTYNPHSNVWKSKIEGFYVIGDNSSHIPKGVGATHPESIEYFINQIKGMRCKVRGTAVFIPDDLVYGEV